MAKAKRKPSKDKIKRLAKERKTARKLDKVTAWRRELYMFMYDPKSFG